MNNMSNPRPTIEQQIEALAHLRQIAHEGRVGPYASIARAIDDLDNAGVFAAVDEARDVCEFAGLPAVDTLDPAEWGDTTHADMARHQQEDQS